MRKLLDYFTRRIIRAFFPGIAQSLEHEGQFQLNDASSADGAIDLSQYIDVEDNGSDTTIICFAGMAVLYAAMPKFEFRKTLTVSGDTYNFIWVRDVYRAFYDVAPDGSPTGYTFYSRLLTDALEKLHSKCNVAIGASAGGAAAFTFSGVLPIHRIIAFNPTFPLEAYCSRRNMFDMLLDVRKLLRTPNTYIETILVVLGVRYLLHRNYRIVGAENMTRPLERYLSKQSPVHATVFYSTGCPADARQVEQFRNVATVSTIPVVSGRHNCMAEMKERGELGPRIHDEILAALSKDV